MFCCLILKKKKNPLVFKKHQVFHLLYSLNILYITELMNLKILSRSEIESDQFHLKFAFLKI